MHSAVTRNACGNNSRALGNLVEVVLRLRNVDTLGGGLIFVGYYRLTENCVMSRGLKNKRGVCINAVSVFNTYRRTTEEGCIMAERNEIASGCGGVSEVGIVKLDLGVVRINVKECGACGRVGIAGLSCDSLVSCRYGTSHRIGIKTVLVKNGVSRLSSPGLIKYGRCAVLLNELTDKANAVVELGNSRKSLRASVLNESVIKIVLGKVLVEGHTALVVGILELPKMPGALCSLYDLNVDSHRRGDRCEHRGHFVVSCIAVSKEVNAYLLVTEIKTCELSNLAISTSADLLGVRRVVRGHLKATLVESVSMSRRGISEHLESVGACTLKILDKSLNECGKLIILLYVLCVVVIVSDGVASRTLALNRVGDRLAKRVCVYVGVDIIFRSVIDGLYLRAVNIEGVVGCVCIGGKIEANSGLISEHESCRLQAGSLGGSHGHGGNGAHLIVVLIKNCIEDLELVSGAFKVIISRSCVGENVCRKELGVCARAAVLKNARGIFRDSKRVIKALGIAVAFKICGKYHTLKHLVRCQGHGHVIVGLAANGHCIDLGKIGVFLTAEHEGGKIFIQSVDIESYSAVKGDARLYLESKIRRDKHACLVDIAVSGLTRLNEAHLALAHRNLSGGCLGILGKNKGGIVSVRIRTEGNEGAVTLGGVVPIERVNVLHSENAALNGYLEHVIGLGYIGIKSVEYGYSLNSSRKIDLTVSEVHGDLGLFTVGYGRGLSVFSDKIIVSGGTGDLNVLEIVLHRLNV